MGNQPTFNNKGTGIAHDGLAAFFFYVVRWCYFSAKQLLAFSTAFFRGVN